MSTPQKTLITLIPHSNIATLDAPILNQNKITLIPHSNIVTLDATILNQNNFLTNHVV